VKNNLLTKIIIVINLSKIHNSMDKKIIFFKLAKKCFWLGLSQSPTYEGTDLIKIINGKKKNSPVESTSKYWKILVFVGLKKLIKMSLKFTLKIMSLGMDRFKSLLRDMIMLISSNCNFSNKSQLANTQ
jgi:hypothetical protein